MRERRTRYATMLLNLALAGCSMAPAYVPPQVASTAIYKEATPWQPAAPADTRIAEDWWTQFGDTTLDRLEGQIATSSPTLAVALSRYDQARGFLRSTQAAGLPNLGISADLTRNRQSDDRPLRSAAQPTYYGAHTVEAQFGFEIDLWGRIRNMGREGAQLEELAHAFPDLGP